MNLNLPPHILLGNKHVDIPSALNVRVFEQPVNYAVTLTAMQEFSNLRDENVVDEVWLLEHESVLSQGQAGLEKHVLLNPTQIPMIQSDRGGQVTWHGPGQLVAYLLYDLKRLNWNVHDLVSRTENAIVAVLGRHGLSAYTRKDAPGVYLQDKFGVELKIGSLGFKLRKNHSYHGLSLNISCDNQGFDCINPCGYAGMRVTRTDDWLTPAPSLPTMRTDLLTALQQLHTVKPAG